ncbi:hypothetical protein ACFFV7_50285 [Nonomuraea spiralis]|uniref:Uncharacterized protein n=1 Tax=Nonomuraea spiralis TaxID=46182 RepID=A0ABV5IYX7_9ACTN|nr:hypothetical protein [Nonomuraea spiralis]GGS89436.1 hypothetical protein GCM10010176_036700 [Nonomuraea spiralis]
MTSETDLGGWGAALDGAFEILLDGKPAADPAAGYGVYYASDPLDEFLFPNPWATPDALSSREPRHLPDSDGEYPFSPWTWRFNLSESLFCFDADLLAGTGPWGDGGHKGPRPFDDAFVADLRTVSSVAESGESLVLGAELGPLLGRHGVDLTGTNSGKLNSWLTVLLRVATDGTLTDAMRAATFTERGPEHLVSIHDMNRVRSAGEPWEERLGAVTHPALRDHLRMLCLSEDDARSEGGFYCGTGHWPWADVLEFAGCSVVAGWGFGESQSGAAVVRLPDAFMVVR